MPRQKRPLTLDQKLARHLAAARRIDRAMALLPDSEHRRHQLRNAEQHRFDMLALLELHACQHEQERRVAREGKGLAP